MNRIATFDDWIVMLDEWRRDIGLDRELVDRFMPGYTFEAKYGELATRKSTSETSRANAGGSAFARSPISA